MPYTKKMNLFQRIYKLLNKPFPEPANTFGLLKSTVVISAFVTFFLFVFQPFGIASLGQEKFIVCLGFGGTTFVAILIYEAIIGRVLKRKGRLEHWTFGKWIMNNLAIILTISLANFFYARLLLFGFIDWELFPAMIYGTFMIGIIPVMVIGGLSMVIQEKKYQSIARDINRQKAAQPNTPVGDAGLLFDIPVNQIQFVEALQNYVSIGYLDPEGQFRKQTERATLRHVLEETTGSPIIKTHRSFLVNQNAITSVTGNAQGLLLELNNTDKKIPVSRSFIPVFRG